jgi:23S rRNA (uracil1939-C5)-methyltransferase
VTWFDVQKNYHISIEKMVVGGYGLGRLDSGKIALVEDALPGEEMVIRPLRQNKDYLLAAPVLIEKKSKDRRTPPCPWNLGCGGCDFQHIIYEAQLRLKQQFVLELFERSRVDIRRLADSFPVTGAPDEFGYRQRIRLHVSEHGSAIGYFRKQTRQVRPVDSCMLADPLINSVLEDLRKQKNFALLSKQIASIELLKNQSRERILLLLSWKRELRPAEKKKLEELGKALPTLGGIYVFDGKGKRIGPLANPEGVHDIEFSINIQAGSLRKKITLSQEPGGFSQVNLQQNQNLVNAVVGLALKEGCSKILDLHCGMGNFALPLSFMAEAVCGVDLQRSAIRAAEENAGRVSAGNCTFMRSSAEQGARELAREGRNFDTIILDPPRQGCRELVPYLAALAARSIIYVSCDPATMVRDLLTLQESGYSIKRVLLFDMFPQTHHVETLVLLGS